MSILNPILGPVLGPVLGPIDRVVLPGLRPGFFRKDPLSVGSIVPFGTSSINEVTATGTTSRTLSIDNTTTFNGTPTTKLVLVGAGSNAQIEVGVNSAVIHLSAEAQALITQHVCFAIKTDGANTVTGGTLFAGDGTYANYYNVGVFPHVVPAGPNGATSDGWKMFEADGVGATASAGTPNLANPVRAKLRLATAANVAPGTIWLAFAGVLPPPVPTVVFTCDDGFPEWLWLAGQAKQRGIPISFGIASSLVGTAGYITQADMLSIANDSSGLFELTCHAQDNTAYVAGNVSTYMASVQACTDYLVGLGCDPYAARLHQYVQGTYDGGVVAALKAAGYYAARTVGPSNRSTANLIDGLQPAQDELFRTSVACSLSNAETLATVQAEISRAATSGTAFILGHQFKSTAGSLTWVNGYDSTYGVLDLLDWLANKRDTEGWRILKWSDWRRRIVSGAPALTHI